MKTDMSSQIKSDIHNGVNALCDAAIAGERDVCDEKLQQLTPHFGRGQISTLLADIAYGNLSCKKSSGFYFIGDIDALSQASITTILDAQNELCKHFASPAPFVVFRLAETPSLPPHYIRLAHDTGILVVNRESFTPNVIIHELAHATVLTGHHGLDEAFAYYAESLLGTDIHESPNRIDIESVFALEHIDTLNDTDEANVLRLYKQGAALFHQLVAHSSPQHLLAYLRQFSYLSANCTIAQSIERFFELRLDAIFGEQADVPVDHLSSLADSVNQCYFSGELAAIDEPLRTLNHFADKLQREQLMALLRGRFAQINYSANQHDADSIAFQALANRYYDLSQNEDASVYSVRIMIECIRMRSASSYLDIQEVATHINALFDQGLTKFPRDGELALMKGKSLFDTPQAQGGDPERAQTYFAIAMQDPNYGSHIHRLVTRYV